MGIKDMLAREDFYKILRETILNYAHIVLQKDIVCEYNAFEGCETWCINSTLGFVSRTPTPRGVRTYMKSEFNVRGSWLKNIIGKIAVDVITAIPAIGTTKKIYISKNVFPKAVFIVPQNRSIRFYNYEEMTVDCIIKAGFTSKYFDNQADFRKTYKYDFLNPMLAQGQGWFREPILTGHPLIRTTDADLFEKGTSEALHYLKQLANDTLKWTPSKQYVENLKADILAKIQLAIEKKGIKELEAANVLTEKAADEALKIEVNIPTIISHGDFQSGNIWAEPSGKILIYDWETAGRRSVWYDSATLSYSLRRVFGWETLLKDKIGQGLYLCIPDGIECNVSLSGIKGIVFLEDVLFYLDDILELPFDWGGEDFDAFINNVKTIDW